MVGIFFLSGFPYISLLLKNTNLDFILDEYSKRFFVDVEVNGNDITRSKPDPQIFLMALEKLDVCCDESIIFEDASLGVEAAKKAEVVTVGVNRHRDSRRLKKADLVVKDLSEVNYSKLKELLKKKEEK